MFKLSFKQQILVGFAVSIAFVFISALASYLSIKSLTESHNWVDHTHEVIRTTEKLEIELINAETGLRGFIITQKDYYKLPYNSSIDKILPMATKLQSLVADNPRQLNIADSISYYAALKVEDMKQIMLKASNLNVDAATAQILTDKGRTYKLKFLKFSNDFTNHELNLLKKRKDANDRESKQTLIVVLLSSVIIFVLIIILLRYIRKTFDQQKETENQILKSNTELAQLSAQNEHNNWLLSGAAEINEAMRGQQAITELATNIISKISNYIDATIGALYLLNDNNNTLTLTGSYAYESNRKIKFSLGEGLIGQSALEKVSKYIAELPADYIKINSGLGQTLPKHLYIIPIVFEEKTVAVIELGFLNKPEEKKLNLINNISENIGIALNSALAHLQLQKLFEQTQQQAEELSSQQEELRTINEELVFKTEELQSSEEELRVQQEELQQANSELEEKAQLLEERNVSINQAKEAISLKAEELELSSKYKSEFLANMSHELRTPLNSILILARILKENRTANLSEEQIKYAGVIHNAGSDLLTLINDILDLSKIESGNIDLVIENVKPNSIKENIESLFTELARQKKIDFNFKIDKNLPATLSTDQARLEQIIKNLLSNAFKFTPEQGSVSIEIGLADQSQILYNQTLKNSTQKPVYISVKDTGIGISEDKQQVIFEAFQQEDGSTSRKYGGTGLGLSISRELTAILGGEIQLFSQQGIGSKFTLFIPQTIDKPTLKNTKEEIILPVIKPLEVIEAPKTNGSNKLLIVEDDENFAEVLKAYAIEKGFEPIMANSGDKGLELATSIIPDAIILDIMLPVMDGWTILKKLKADPKTQHIPIHMMSAGDEKISKAKKEGAIGFLRKPVEKEKLDEAFNLLSNQYQYHFNNVLIIDDNVFQNDALKDQLIKKDARIKQAFTGKEALKLLEDNVFDCIILDLKLPDISGFELLDRVKSNSDLKNIPVIINTAMELSKDEMAHILKYTQAMVLKSNKSNDRLLDEVSLFMNKLQSNPTKPDAKEERVNYSITIEKALQDKTILIADDDMRNIFALSSALQGYDIDVIIAGNGIEALDKLEQNKKIDLVLMDIMMPEMDGYEAMRKIRAQKQFANLPIIALTAKAMKNDREKCIEAGANDYISKPVDVDKLLSMIRVWLS